MYHQATQKYNSEKLRLFAFQPHQCNSSNHLSITVYRVDDGFFDEARIIEFDEDLSGSNQYGVVRAHRSGEPCESTAVGAKCNWAEDGLGGTAKHLVRDYSLQAKLNQSEFLNMLV